jgi:hypothetical protein
MIQGAQELLWSVMRLRMTKWENRLFIIKHAIKAGLQWEGHSFQKTQLQIRIGREKYN